MALADNSHVQIGGVSYRLDESYQQLVGRRPYVHGGRNIFANRTDITGKPGAQNLKEDYLVWSQTRWDGEGQVVLDPADPDSPFLIYRSEGIDFRTAGQGKLNKSILSETVSTTSATTTKQGAADYTDITGTSTTSGTDRKLVAVNDKVAESASMTPGASNVQLDFYMFYDAFANGATTIQGSAFNVVDGSAPTSGTDRIIGRGDSVRSEVLTTGSELTAGVTTRVEFYIAPTLTDGLWTRCAVVDMTGINNIVAATNDVIDSASGTPSRTLTFVPKTGHSYRIQVNVGSSIEPTHITLTLDKVIYGAEVTSNTATIEVWNQTAGSSVTTKTVSVDAIAAGSKVASISFQGVAATDYRARVKRTAGSQAIWVDKTAWNVLTAASWTIDCLDLGIGNQSSGVFTPQVWAAAHATAVDSRGFVYNATTDVWDSVATLDDATGTGLITYAMAHSDAAEYFLQSSNEVIRCDYAGNDTVTYKNIPAAVGMTIAQNRLFVMSEGAAGVTIYKAPLVAAGTNITTDVTVTSSTFEDGAKSPDLSLRQRMCSTPDGARFFVNFGDVTAKVYQADGSGGGVDVTELADLGHGIKATCIAYENGITFVGAQYYGDSTASDTDKMPRSALFAIDQNGYIQRIGFMRRDNPDVRPPVFIVPYQTDLFILQGNYVWRYSLVSGGLYCEYQLDAQTPANQRAIVVALGRIFAGYTTEIFVAGSVGTYRQSSVTDGNSFTTSVNDFGLPSTRKTLAKIDLLTNSMPSAASVRVEYQIDQNGTWTLAGTHSSGSTQTFYIADTSFETLQLRVTLISTSGVNTPKVLGITAWATSAQDEEYFDLVLWTEDEDSSHHIDGEQVPGTDKAGHLVDLWRRKVVTSFTDGYGSNPPEDHIVTVQDIRVENTADLEGRTVLTLKVVR